MTVLYKNGKDKLPPRNDHDFYATPPGFARAALRELPDDFVPATVLDPGAGTGVWGRACVEKWPQCLVGGVDLRDVPIPAGYTWWTPNQDFRTWQCHSPYDLVLGNPPFKHAEIFIRYAMTMLNAGRYCMYLLRLAFLAEQDRYKRLWKEYPPKRVVVASRRIAFTGNNNPNSYALFIWQQGWVGETTLGWMLHEDNAQEDAKPSAWRQLSMFDDV